MLKLRTHRYIKCLYTLSTIDLIHISISGLCLRAPNYIRNQKTKKM